MSDKLTIGLYGLGKMGKNIGLNMLGKNYNLVVYNRSKDKYAEFKYRATCADSISDFIKALRSKSSNIIVWVMLTAGSPTNDAISELMQYLVPNDILIDGSNSRYTDSINNSRKLFEKGIKYLDAGCSGGPSGARNGMSIMVGGDKQTFDKLEELIRDLSVKDGYLYTGSAGSGHFTKMVHNAIEYGMMQSIAEGLELLENGPYKDLNLEHICNLWQHGSVIRSYLVETAMKALSKDPKLSLVAPYVEDSGEGRWSVETAISYGVPLPVITHSLFERFASRSDKKFANRALAAMRHEFGGHDVKLAENEK